VEEREEMPRGGAKRVVVVARCAPYSGAAYCADVCENGWTDYFGRIRILHQLFH